ncbi:hypothetical protein [Solicola sp. PLA-1-18]|uniref:hypothetical protein n=1 Tax=Solicola sp. PLA-1-18 TaxID=3380532 RepID=UPI003B7D9D2B
MTPQLLAIAVALVPLLVVGVRFWRVERRHRRLALPTDEVDVPTLPMGCFTGRLDLLSDDELARRWDVSGVVVRGGGDPVVVASAASDRAIYLDEMERRRDHPAGDR